MPDTCIICGGPAGSGEHLFPASLGGRRTNRGIYCDTHNQAFSPLVAVLNDQLREVNSFLSIRPDRKKIPHRFTFTDDAGDELIVSGTKIYYAHPKIISERQVGEGQVTTIRVSTQAEADQWIADQRKLGNNVKMISSEKRTKVFTEGFSINLDLGGPDALRAVGYLCLTYLAHFFPKVAAYGQLNSFKDFIQGISDNQFVWWNTENPIQAFSANPFSFGHSVALGLDVNTRSACAAFSFFSTLNFSIQFGTCPIDGDKTAVVHIDPLAERARNDIQEEWHDQRLLAVIRPNDLTQYLAFNVQSGLAEASFTNLFRNIALRNLRKTSDDLFRTISDATAQPTADLQATLRPFVHAERQRLLNLLVFCLDELRPEFIAKFGRTPTERAFAIIETDDDGEDGLSQSTAALVNKSVDAITARIGEAVTAGTLDVDYLMMTLGGGPGAAAVMAACYPELANAIASEVRRHQFDQQLRSSVSMLALWRGVPSRQ